MESAYQILDGFVQAASFPMNGGFVLCHFWNQTEGPFAFRAKLTSRVTTLSEFSPIA
jgi:hypothetical protein